MNQSDPKRDILALVDEVLVCLQHHNYQSINCLLFELKRQLEFGDFTTLNEKECIYLLDAYQALAEKNAYFPLLLKTVKRSKIRCEELALLENNPALQAEKQTLTSTIHLLEGVTAQDLSSFIEVKRRTLILGEADLEILARAEEILKRLI